ncbi:ROK family protein [Aquihabitans sp. G128]|uniref:ROK family protein n=1 Tax=Aquihabitans sp. G128 TaxID=2849779 RepID=UPI001C24C4AD|nr:ROK family protein [Aquihabitans sp. G128]QXC62284.1 ROK family protein [Aquihabitans sp. G128]
MEHVLAVDIGGTKMAAAVVDAAGAVVARRQVPTEGDGGEGLFATLTTLVDQVRAESGLDVAGCGVGCGGPMSAGGETVSPLNIGEWREFPLRERLAAHTGLTTWVDNDAKALALGEGWIGAAAGHHDYVAMVVSTGVGGGIVLDGRLLDGTGGNAGHIGHMNVVPDGRLCACGAHGCLEAEASGTAIAATTGKPAKEASAEVRRRTGTLVGRAVGSVASLLDLQLACVAGSVALGFGDAFFVAAQAEIDRTACIAHARGTTIRPGGLGDAGPLVGAAAVAWRALGHDVGVR